MVGTSTRNTATKKGARNKGKEQLECMRAWEQQLHRQEQPPNAQTTTYGLKIPHNYLSLVE